MSSAASGAERPLRVVVLDDAPYVSWDGRTYAANATFHRFLAALPGVAERAGSPISLVLVAPVRPALTAPATLAVDERIDVVATAPFDGIAGYMRRAPMLVARNVPRIRAALRDADVLLLRLPASNGMLAALAAVARGVPRLAYVVGSTRAVVAGQRRSGPAGLAARVVAAGYDAATRVAGARAPVIVVGADAAAGGILSSVVAPDEIRRRADEPWPAVAGALRLVYAGRLAEGKGLHVLLEAVAILAGTGLILAGAAVGVPGVAAGGVPAADGSARFGDADWGVAEGGTPAADGSVAEGGVSLDLIGSGPAEPALRNRAAALGIAGRVRFAGYLAERGPYLAALAAADLFVSPSPAEGFPKTILDAMAAGTPVVAVPAGRLVELADPAVTRAGAPILAVSPGDPEALAAAIRFLAADPAIASRLRTAGTAFVAEHTAPAEAARLLARLRATASTRSRRRG